MNTLNALNNCSKGFKKVADLEVGTKYRILKMTAINTKYGAAVLVNIENMGDVILPKRFSTLIDQIDQLNEDFEKKSTYLEVFPAVGKYVPIEFTE